MGVEDNPATSEPQQTYEQMAKYRDDFFLFFKTQELRLYKTGIMASASVLNYFQMQKEKIRRHGHGRQRRSMERRQSGDESIIGVDIYLVADNNDEGVQAVTELEANIETWLTDRFNWGGRGSNWNQSYSEDNRYFQHVKRVIWQ